MKIQIIENTSVKLHTAVCAHFNWSPQHGFASGSRRKYHGPNGASLFEGGATAFQIQAAADALHCTPDELIVAIKELNQQHRTINCGGAVNESILNAVQEFSWSYKRTRMEYRIHGTSLQVWEAGEGWRLEISGSGAASLAGAVPAELIAITKAWNFQESKSKTPPAP